MRIVNSLADRLVGMVAPKATAGACIAPEHWTQECSCKGHLIWVKGCTNNCAGVAICGRCYNDYISC